MPLDRCRRLNAEDVENCRHDVYGVVVLVAQFTGGLQGLRPRDDAGVTYPAFELVALPHLERRVERHSPAGRIVVVGAWAAEFIDQRQILLGSSGMPLKNLFSFTEPSGPPSPDAPLSETTITTVFSLSSYSSR